MIQKEVNKDIVKIRVKDLRNFRGPVTYTFPFPKGKFSTVFDVEGVAEVPSRVAERLLNQKLYPNLYILADGGDTINPITPRHIDLGRDPDPKPAAKVEAKPEVKQPEKRSKGVEAPKVEAPRTTGEQTEFVKAIVD